MSESLSKAAKKNARRHAAKRAKRFSEEPTREGECEASVEKENMESTAAEDNSEQNERTVCEETSVIPSVTSSVTLSIDEEIAEVKKQLDEAKAAQEHDKARTLRRKLWTLKDKAHLGSSESRNAPHVGQAVLSTDAVAMIQKLAEKSIVGASPQVPQSSTTDPEKRLRNLKKKLHHIDELKAKKEGGNQLEETQLTKIASEMEIIDEIKELEELLATAEIQ